MPKIPEDRARKAEQSHAAMNAKGNTPIIAAGSARRQSAVSVAGEDGEPRN